MTINRRDFLATTAAGVAIPALGTADAVITQLERRSVPPPPPRFAPPPVVISSDNGHISKNADGKTGVQVAYDMIARGADTLDAIVSGVNIVERDPNDQSVGLGGLPMKRASCSSTRRACTAPPGARERSDRSRVSPRRRWSPRW